jgi:ribonuclease HI
MLYLGDANKFNVWFSSGDLPEWVLFTDGAKCGQMGGWGYVLLRAIDGRHKFVKEDSGYSLMSTSNRMEYTAAIYGLQKIPDGGKVALVSDSQLLLHSMSQWMPMWKQRGWHLKDGGEIKNFDLVYKLYCLSVSLDIQYVWVRGHCGIQYNERCDFLAGKAVERGVRIDKQKWTNTGHGYKGKYARQRNR